MSYNVVWKRLHPTKELTNNMQVIGQFTDLKSAEDYLSFLENSAAKLDFKSFWSIKPHYFCIRQDLIIHEYYINP
jgi:hypothetical protein